MLRNKQPQPIKTPPKEMNPQNKKKNKQHYLIKKHKNTHKTHIKINTSKKTMVQSPKHLLHHLVHSHLRHLLGLWWGLVHVELWLLRSISIVHVTVERLLESRVVHIWLEGRLAQICLSMGKRTHFLELAEASVRKGLAKTSFEAGAVNRTPAHEVHLWHEVLVHWWGCLTQLHWAVGKVALLLVRAGSTIAHELAHLCLGKWVMATLLLEVGGEGLWFTKITLAMSKPARITILALTGLFKSTTEASLLHQMAIAAETSMMLLTIWWLLLHIVLTLWETIIGWLLLNVLIFDHHIISGRRNT
eukprot:m.42563 g.42563  ORF g.42563 m.42563 type:complete len:303 (+) comp10524_c0_seq1:298-1206(+)